MKGEYVFTQICRFLPREEFKWFIRKYEGNKSVKTFKCWNQLLALIFGQLAGCESLRVLVSSLQAHESKLYHLGIGKNISVSNFAHANQVRNPRIFEDLANLMIKMARDKRLGAVNMFFIEEGNVYAFDSTTISLCLARFDWSRLHHDKGGIKVHTLYDVKSDVPGFYIITNADLHDSQVMDDIPYESGSFYIFDRGYMDTEQLFFIHKAKAFFVVREKINMCYEVVEDLNYSNAETGVVSDQRIRFTVYKTAKQYPEDLRRVVYHDEEHQRDFVFYTNNLSVSAEDVALLYKYRWRVELFFKWIKQHLHVKEFYGYNENAVRIQIHVAIITYCLVAIIEHDLDVKMDTYYLLRILSVSLLDKTPIRELLLKAKGQNFEQNDNSQLLLNLEF